MKQTLMALRAFGVLLAIWTILAGIAFAAGVIPMPGADEVAANGDGESDADGEEGADGVGDGDADGGADGDGENDGDGEESADGVGDTDGDGPAEVVLAPPVYVICSAETEQVSLAALEVVGDARPEVAVGCGPKLNVFAFGEDTEQPVPLRVATFDGSGGAAPSAQASVAAGTAAGMDIDGDGLGDLVLPFRGLTAEGDVRGGALHLLRRNAMGAFEAPLLLAPIASDLVVLAQLDAQPGFEVLATNRGSDLARRPSEVWVFSGGAAPARASILRAGLGDVAVAVADLDRDGHEDAVVTAAGADQVRIHFGDGTSHFPRTAEVPLEGATEVVAGDVDGDGGEDVVLLAGGLHLVAAGPPESLSPTPLPAPAALEGISLRDVDGDRKRDIVGMDGQRVVWLRQGADLSFSEETLVVFEETPLRHYVLADVDGDGKTDLVALGRGAEPAPWVLTIVPNVAEVARVTFEARGASAAADAPLMLNVALR